MGTVVSMLVTGYISASWSGWPMVFYVYGGLGLVWAILMGIFGANTPSESKNISEEERVFIESSLVGHKSDEVSRFLSFCVL